MSVGLCVLGWGLWPVEATAGWRGSRSLPVWGAQVSLLCVEHTWCSGLCGPGPALHDEGHGAQLLLGSPEWTQRRQGHRRSQKASPL